jgi:hypothetical protein
MNTVMQERSSRFPSSREGSEDGGFRLEPAPGGIIPLSSAMTGKREMIMGKLSAHDIPEKTASEIESELLEAIDGHIQRYAYANRFNPKTINGQVYVYFGKPRRLMTIPELEICLKHVQQTYPLSFVRGTGHRVSTKATPINCVWR